ncbi:MAG: diaminopimelate decarboxylase [Sphaerochaetaceae bacterium]
MNTKVLPLSDSRMFELSRKLPTPFYLYDERAIVENAKAFKSTFSWVPGFTNYYAVKACPNPAIISLLSSLGFGTDCSSMSELLLAHACGVQGKDIMFTSNDTPVDEFDEAYRLGAVINLDDITHIGSLHNIPQTICFRYNPGSERTGNAIIGNPVDAKYGVRSDQIVDCYRIMKKKGVKRFGLHTMVASNELDGQYIVETARMLFSLCRKISEESGVRISFLDLGGGIGIPYRPEQERMDIARVSGDIHTLYDEMIVDRGLGPVSLSFECGRYITGPYGYLVTKVRHVTRKYKQFVGVDATMADLMRPGMYGAYHHITVLGKEGLPADHTYDVTGSLCENNDKFAVDRMLPEVDEGDILVIHDAGAHGYSMGFNYNGKLRHAEYLLHADGLVSMIRRAETYDDYVATLRFPRCEVNV